jgi:hypothetical protein
VAAKIPVYLEVGGKRAFASAVHWPGWSRSGRSADEALQTLAGYGPRYARVVKRAVPAFVAPADTAGFDIVARLTGNATTDFGVPGLGLPSDKRPLKDDELERLISVQEACWSAFDRASRQAAGVELRKGPRGGGRDLDKMAAHVIDAEAAYAVKLGVRPAKSARPAALREAILAALRARARGLPVANPSGAKTLWAPRYFVRRAAWHVLDHAWEIEDRATG